MYKMLKIMSFLVFIGLLNSCGSSSDPVSTSDSVSNTDGSNENNSSVGNGKIDLSLSATYQFPYIFRSAFVDEDNVILVGGQIGRKSTEDVNIFSNKIIKINLLTGVSSELTLSENRGNDAKIYKLVNGKYLVTSGFQTASYIDVVDFTTNNVKSISTDLNITDSTGQNITPFYVDSSAPAVLDSGDMMFFGFYNGLYAMKEVMLFNYNDENVTLSPVELGMARYGAVAHKLADNRVIIVGGWDGSTNSDENSSQRRVEIYNPSDGSINRVANYPAPISFSSVKKVENDAIWVGDYKYTVSQDTWEYDSIFTLVKELSANYNISTDITLYGAYLTTLSNGKIVTFFGGNESSVYSDTIQAYPVNLQATLRVFTPSN